MWTERRTRTLSGAACIGVLALCLTACPTAVPPVGSGGATPPEQVVAADGREGRLYRVVADQSLLQIFAYRGGSLARLGHNHVIAARHLQGNAWLPDDLRQARFDLTIPVALLTIDEVELRAAAGADFASDVPDSARDATRRNLLSESLLDADRFPGIRLRLLELAPAADRYEAIVAVTVKDTQTTLPVPLQLTTSAEVLRASGELVVKQSQLGLNPFGVMLGALTVEDELRIKFTVTARSPAVP